MTNFHFQSNRPPVTLPATMSAVQLLGHGGFDQLSFSSNVATPNAGEGEVIVRVHAASVNNTDINMRQGWYSKSVSTGTDSAQTSGTLATDTGWSGEEMQFPRIQGADGVGFIVAVGPSVSPSRIGERVLLDPILRPTEHAPNMRYLGSDCDGTFAEYVKIPSTNAVTIHCNLTDEELASFPCAYLAALNLIDKAYISPDDTVVVTGASGGVGSAVVELAHAVGAKVIAMVHPSKIKQLSGTDDSIRWVSRLEPLTESVGEEAVDAVIDVVGGSVFNEALHCLVSGGRYAVAGAIGGPIVRLDLRTLYLKDLHLIGCTIPREGLFQELVQKIESGIIKPKISSSFRLSEMVRAQEQFLARSHLGKIIIKM
jgi:NADPH:quinone reductase-like Zn-dependent oxidoreductase